MRATAGRPILRRQHTGVRRFLEGRRGITFVEACSLRVAASRLLRVPPSSNVEKCKQVRLIASRTSGRGSTLPSRRWHRTTSTPASHQPWSQRRQRRQRLVSPSSPVTSVHMPTTGTRRELPKASAGRTCSLRCLLRGSGELEATQWGRLQSEDLRLRWEDWREAYVRELVQCATSSVRAYSGQRASVPPDG